LNKNFQKYQDTGNRLVPKKKSELFNGAGCESVKNDPVSCVPSSWVTYASKINVYRNSVQKKCSNMARQMSAGWI